MVSVESSDALQIAIDFQTYKAYFVNQCLTAWAITIGIPRVPS